MHSSHTRPVCRPQLENLEDRLAPNNMLSVADALAAGLSSFGGWTASDLFADLLASPVSLARTGAPGEHVSLAFPGVQGCQFICPSPKSGQMN